MALNAPSWKPGDRIPRGPGDTLQVVEVRAGPELVTLVVRSGPVRKSD